MFIRKKRTPSDTVALFDQLARRQEPRISRAFMAGLENVRDRVNATRLEQLLSSGDTNAILQLLSLDQSRRISSSSRRRSIRPYRKARRLRLRASRP